MKLLYEVWRANELYDWGIALAIAALSLMVLAVLRRLMARIVGAVAARTLTRVDDSLVEVVRATRLLLLVPLAVYLGSLVLELPKRLDSAIVAVVTVSLLIQAGMWVNRFIGGWIEQEVARRRADGDTVTAMQLLGFVARVVVWALTVLLILDQLSFNITALVAGLGIGGVAVALAVQNILSDLFASFSILLDKPFVVGDFIIVGSELGTVEQVGIKTTRVRSLSGELIIFPNGDLLKSRIRNYKRMYERRVVFSFGLVYHTPPEKIERAVAIVRAAIETSEKTRFDRAHFKEYGDSSLNFEVVYYVLDPDYNLYMDVQHRINLAMLREFAREGIEFAYPTRVVHLAGNTGVGPVAEAEARPR